MRKNFGEKTCMYPMPVLVVGSYDENGNPDAMIAAWGGIYDYGQIMLCLAHEHKTTDNIKKLKAFTVSFATAEQVKRCDYLGVVSAKECPDKLERAGFHCTKSRFVNAPIIDELPMTLECELIKFNEDGECIGKIVNFSVDEKYIGSNGEIEVKRIAPLIFDGMTNSYWSFGEKVGDAFTAEKL